MTDRETKLAHRNIYMGARYLDPKYSRWISVDPALAEYIPGAGKSDEADKLPGMGGIYNSVNGNLYHYAGNNPVRYLDPDGREDAPYNISFGNHDLLPTFKGIDTGDKWYNNLWDGFVSYCVEGTYNLVASSINLLNNGIFSGFELYETGINWLDENWSYNLTFSGNGVKADLEMYAFVFMSNPQIFCEAETLLSDCFNYFEITGKLTKNQRQVLDLIIKSTPGRETKGKTIQYDRKGNFSNALYDFNKFKPKNVQNYSTSKGPCLVGYLDDGRKINVRNFSSGGFPTIEIQEGQKALKFRYME